MLLGFLTLGPFVLKKGQKENPRWMERKSRGYPTRQLQNSMTKAPSMEKVSRKSRTKPSHLYVRYPYHENLALSQFATVEACIQCLLNIREMPGRLHLCNYKLCFCLIQN